MPTNAWVVYGDSGDTLVLHRTALGKIKLRVIQGDRVTSAVLPLAELYEAVAHAAEHEHLHHPTEE